MDEQVYRVVSKLEKIIASVGDKERDEALKRELSYAAGLVEGLITCYSETPPLEGVAPKKKFDLKKLL